jgi:hypothetical protein
MTIEASRSKEGLRPAPKSGARAATGGLLLACLLVCSSTVRADWSVYVAGDLGYSVLDGSASGQALLVSGPPTLNLGGSDDDVSPLVGGAVGIAAPLDETTRSDLPFGWRLPPWRARAEIEAIGLREYNLRTREIVSGSGTLHTKVEAWTVMSNLWLDVPLRGLYRPISWTSARLFGRWRLQALKQALDRTTFDLGGGIGVAGLDLSTTDGVVNDSETTYNFAWQVGGGLGYQLTDRIKVGLGYRYIDVGTAKYRIGGAGTGLVRNSSSFKLDPDIHEARASLRVDVFDFARPWR